MAKIEELIAKEDFLEQLKGMTDCDQIIELFGKNGVQIAKEEAKAIIAALSDKDELAEEDLSGVFGGMIVPHWLRDLYSRRKNSGKGGSFTGGGGFSGGSGGGGGRGF